MNAIETITERPRAPSSAPHPTHKFWLLLRRELWEHKGGFLWVPLIAGGVFLVLSLIFFEADFKADKMGWRGGVAVKVNINGLDLRAIDLGDVRDLGHVADPGWYMVSAWPLIALGFVMFFYCLGALYDERKDRSVLFWKSLPLSDQAIVLSKVASAVLVAPGLATAIAIVTMLVFFMMVSVKVLVNGGNPVPLLWEPGGPLAVAGSLLAGIPVYAVWALPTVGWLLLCSAWAKNKPFLWAIMIPVFAGVFVTWSQPERAWFWKNIVSRVLFGIMPGAWLPFTDGVRQTAEHGWEFTRNYLANTYGIFATPQPWVGAVAGAVMIYGAVRVRRWRDEG